MAKGWGKKGIGDYIHYKASDYYRYGLNIPLEDKSTTSNSSSLISADLNRIHQEILADSHLRGDESKAKELEKQLNRFYNRDSKEVTDKFTDDEYKMIESTLSNNVSNITDNLVIDTKHLDADYIVDTYGLRGAHSELMAKSSDGKIGLRIKSIEHMMKDLQMVLNNIYAKYGPQIDAGVMSQNFTTLVKEAESSLKAIEAQFGTLTELQQSNPNSLRRFSGGRGQALQNFQEKYNNLRKYLIQSKAFTKGQLGEFGTAAILAAA